MPVGARGLLVTLGLEMVADLIMSFYVSDEDCFAVGGTFSLALLTAGADRLPLCAPHGLSGKRRNSRMFPFAIPMICKNEMSKWMEGASARRRAGLTYAGVGLVVISVPARRIQSSNGVSGA